MRNAGLAAEPDDTVLRQLERPDVKTTILRIALLLFGVSTLHTGAAAQATSAKVVLELFTSQGCSSCPPADALLESYTKRGDIIALSLPVDYWDRLGWKDTFASSEHTKRQRDYASARGDGQVYTPQVGGKFHVVGSSRPAIDSAIAAAKTALQESQVPLSVHFEDGALVVQVGGAPAGAATQNARLLLAVVQDAGSVSIRRGENANRTVTYYNIVRALKTIGAWDRHAVGAAGANSLSLALSPWSCCCRTVSGARS